VTYASALASNVEDIKVAVGAVKSVHPTYRSAGHDGVRLDEMAPGRIILLGSALPLRLAQMASP
jgi:hypothetical protein